MVPFTREGTRRGAKLGGLDLRKSDAFLRSCLRYLSRVRPSTGACRTWIVLWRATAVTTQSNPRLKIRTRPSTEGTASLTNRRLRSHSQATDVHILMLVDESTARVTATPSATTMGLQEGLSAHSNHHLKHTHSIHHVPSPVMLSLMLSASCRRAHAARPLLELRTDGGRQIPRSAVISSRTGEAQAARTALMCMAAGRASVPQMTFQRCCPGRCGWISTHSTPPPPLPLIYEREQRFGRTRHVYRTHVR